MTIEARHLPNRSSLGPAEVNSRDDVVGSVAGHWLEFAKDVGEYLANKGVTFHTGEWDSLFRKSFAAEIMKSICDHWIYQAVDLVIDEGERGLVDDCIATVGTTRDRKPSRGIRGCHFCCHWV